MHRKVDLVQGGIDRRTPLSSGQENGSLLSLNSKMFGVILTNAMQTGLKREAASFKFKILAALCWEKSKHRHRYEVVSA